ncbi:hypothetical protein GALMADRAFT_227227 [Galerina marginata CBS 339.88]|uniref:Uncharacterized protein n=1 Tax=Galerina marginata (strain CBS 339.88) TaxID=685588 RepID=A0A067SXU1_GALM3|nr:hypothetical protein GALMADRAFT_227227 [Galerina marginata CBS 339.88]
MRRLCAERQGQAGLPLLSIGETEVSDALSAAFSLSSCCAVSFPKPPNSISSTQEHRYSKEPFAIPFASEDWRNQGIADCSSQLFLTDAQSRVLLGHTRVIGLHIVALIGTEDINYEYLWTKNSSLNGSLSYTGRPFIQTHIFMSCLTSPKDSMPQVGADDEYDEYDAREWIRASQLTSQLGSFERQLSGCACSNLNLATNLITQNTEAPSGSSLDIAATAPPQRSSPLPHQPSHLEPVHCGILPSDNLFLAVDG